jgi:two-component system, OmpR family, response regulator
VVDDEEIWREVVTQTLKSEGYEVCPAKSPGQALEIVRRDPPIDVVLSDIKMPEIPGTQLIREIARISPQITPILMTAGIVNPAEAPGIRILRKPISRTDLISAVRRSVMRSVELRSNLRDTRLQSVETRKRSEKLRAEVRRVSAEAAETQRESRTLCEWHNQRRKP